MEHYYTQNPKSEYTEHKISTVILGRKMDFTTADGVFSKSRADEGTLVLLNALFLRHKNIGRLLDLGCGYGIIGISAAIISGARPVMRDINERAVMLAVKNAKSLGVEADIQSSDGLEGVEGKFDIIVTNPPIRAGKDVFYPWIENAGGYLGDEGELWVVAQKKQGAPSIKKLMQDTFGNCETVKKDGGYYVLVSKKGQKLL